MKALFILLISTSFIINAQGPAFYDIEGKLIENNINTSINEVVSNNFKNIDFIDVFYSENKNCEGYEVVFKKFTEKPLFIFGKMPKNKRKLNKCIEKYNVISVFSGFSFKNDLDSMINDQISPEKASTIFGNAWTETLDKEAGSEILIYNYNKYYGTVKFDLIFHNNKLSRYITY